MVSGLSSYVINSRMNGTQCARDSDAKRWATFSGSPDGQDFNLVKILIRLRAFTIAKFGQREQMLQRVFLVWQPYNQ